MLRNKLADPDEGPVPQSRHGGSIAAAPLSSHEKVKLFRQLFRGREDLYPTRFVSKKSGKPGYIGEGFDDARLETLFLALPVSWKGTLVQYTGRLHRLYPGKREVRIFDYVDRNVPMLLRMFERRLRGYRAIGYARGEAPLGYGEPNEVGDGDVLRVFDHDSATDRGGDFAGESP